jgi:hypothetical protein
MGGQFFEHAQVGNSHECSWHGFDVIRLESVNGLVAVVGLDQATVQLEELRRNGECIGVTLPTLGMLN